MTEQNAHDDERDTADLATNDAADLAAGDATDLVTDDTADLAIDDTSDSAVDDASDLAAGDAADLATADAARSQPTAGQLTPAGRAVSPSPSPPAHIRCNRPPCAPRAQAAVEARNHSSHDGAFGRIVRPDDCGRRRLRVRNPRRGCRRQAQHGGDAAGIGSVA